MPVVHTRHGTFSAGRNAFDFVHNDAFSDVAQEIKTFLQMRQPGLPSLVLLLALDAVILLHLLFDFLDIVLRSVDLS